MNFLIRLITLPVCLMVLLFNSALAEKSDSSYEQSLIQAIADIQQLNHKQAIDDTRRLIEQYPTSKVGQMLYGDLLLAKAGVLSTIGFGIQQQPQLDDLTLEIRQRLTSQNTPANNGLLPNSLIKLAQNQPYYLLLDHSQSRLYVYRNNNGVPELEVDYFLSIGLMGSGKEKRGDQKTPIGIYHVTGYIDDKALPDLYGKGAFPVNYPNIWDKRKKRTGDGIWIHGTPSYTYNRAPLSSNGCMVVSNPDFLDLKQYIKPRINTPVIMVESIHWIEKSEWEKQRQQFMSLISEWAEDWENRLHPAYINHYSKSDFQSRKRNFAQWSAYKKRVNSSKKFINVEFTNLSIYRYPQEQDLILMQYDQSYRSNNLNIESPKELYWQQENEGWKIVYEGSRNIKSKKHRTALKQSAKQ